MKIILFLLLLFIMGMGFSAYSQEYSPYFNLDQHKKYTDYLVNSGKLKIVNSE